MGERRGRLSTAFGKDLEGQLVGVGGQLSEPVRRRRGDRVHVEVRDSDDVRQFRVVERLDARAQKQNGSSGEWGKKRKRRKKEYGVDKGASRRRRSRKEKQAGSKTGDGRTGWSKPNGSKPCRPEVRKKNNLKWNRAGRCDTEGDTGDRATQQGAPRRRRRRQRHLPTT